MRSRLLRLATLSTFVAACGGADRTQATSPSVSTPDTTAQDPAAGEAAVGDGNETATLSWTPSTNPAVTGYRVYWGHSPRAYVQRRGEGRAVGLVDRQVIHGLGRGRTYHFAVTAVDAQGNESGFSNEATKTVP